MFFKRFLWFPSLFYIESSGLILASHRLFLSANFNCFSHGFFRFEQLLRLDKLLEFGFVHVRDVDGKERKLFSKGK